MKKTLDSSLMLRNFKSWQPLCKLKGAAGDQFAQFNSAFKEARRDEENIDY